MTTDLVADICAAVALASLLLLASNVLLAPALRAIRVLAGRRRLPARRSIESISIIVPAYNEEKTIGEKIDSLRRALAHVDVAVEVLIGSDGSTDRTADIVRSCFAQCGAPHWRLLEFPNEGKCGTINKLVAAARGELIVSTDADIPVPESAIRTVLNAFESDDRLGCVSCIPQFDGLDIGSQNQYWRIEDQIRGAESALGRLIVVTGMLYGYRRELFEEMPRGIMADDLWIPLNVLLKGYQSAQIDDLRVPYEETDEELEVVRRKRVIVGGMDVIRRLWQRLIGSPSVLLLVMIHKVNRWASPLWLFLFLGAAGVLMPWLFYGYAVGIALAFWHLGSKRFRRLAYAAISPILSFAEVMGRADFALWEHTRKH